MNRRAEIQVGLTVLVALSVLLLGVTWLKDFNLQRKVTVWHVRFPETGGLGASDEVQVNGIRKGAVSKVELAGDHVVVDLALASEIRLTHDSRVVIRNIGLMGERVIAVDLRTTGDAYTARDTIPGIYEAGLSEAMARVGGTMSSVDTLIARLDRVLAQLDHGDDLQQTLVHLRATSEELHAAVAEDRGALHATLEDTRAAAHSVRDAAAGSAEQVHRVLDSAERASRNLDQLSARLDSLRATAQRVGDKLDRGDGTAAKLVNDPRLYDETRTTIESLRSLIEDIRQHPKKYIHVSVF